MVKLTATIRGTRSIRDTPRNPTTIASPDSAANHRSNPGRCCQRNANDKVYYAQSASLHTKEATDCHKTRNPSHEHATNYCHGKTKAADVAPSVKNYSKLPLRKQNCWSWLFDTSPNPRQGLPRCFYRMSPSDNKTSSRAQRNALRNAVTAPIHFTDC